MPRLSPSVATLVIACLFSICSVAEAQNIKLTVNVNGPVSGAVGIQGLNGNVCNPNPGGGPTNASCDFFYPVNTPLRLAANSPNPFPGFLHSGTTSDTAHCQFSTCDIVLTQDSAITATFHAPPGQVAAIQIALSGDGRGNVGADNNQCQNFELGNSACVTYYAVGSGARFTGRSMPGNIFAGFTGSGDTAGCGGITGNVCEFNVTANSTIDAAFSALQSVALTPNPATRTVGQSAFFTATGTFFNGMQRQSFNGNSPWQDHLPMDVARFSLAAAAVNGRLYAIGGTGAAGTLGTVENFNPLATLASEFDQAWTEGEPMPTPRHSLAAVVANNRIFAIGGHGASGDAVASMEGYDPSADMWSVAHSMPTARAGAAAAAIGDTIYVVGGNSAAASAAAVALNTVEAYDAMGNTWASLTPMTTPRLNPAAAAVNGVLYVIGGDGTGSVEAFTPGPDTWTARAPMPGAGGAHVAVALNGLIYVVGGPSGTMKVYNPAVDSWTTLGDMQFALRRDFALAAFDGRVFAVGGRAADDTAAATLSANRPPEATWWSSNTAVARVNGGNNGNVSALSAGTATITARLVTIEGNALLTVNAPQPPQIFLSLPNTSFTEVGSTGSWGCGTFGQNADGPWEVKINYGDGTGDVVTPYSTSALPNCGGGPGTKGWFSFNHTYDASGTYQVTVSVKNTSTNQVTTQSFNVQVQPAPPCEVQIISNITKIGTVPLTQVDVKVFAAGGETSLFEGALPFGSFDEAGLPEGQYRIEFSVPDGFIVTPSSFDVDAVCGTPIHLNATVSASPAGQVTQLIATVESFNLQQGIANSLDAKLDHILSALNSANSGDTTAVCNQLGAFINETQAQSGKKLTVEQAGQLIAAAQQIRATIGCQ